MTFQFSIFFITFAAVLETILGFEVKSIKKGVVLLIFNAKFSDFIL